MVASKTSRKYIEMAVRENIAKVRPDYPPSLVEKVVSASMNGLDVKKDTLYRAIELAALDAKIITAPTGR